MDNQIQQIAERVGGLRRILELTPEDMAEACGVSVADYLEHEDGRQDFSFTFLYKCAEKFGVDITELISGDTPKLSYCSLVRSGKGLSMERRKGFTYRHLGYLLKNRLSEPFIVTAKYRAEEQNAPIQLSTHKGQELDFILRGKLKFRFENNTVLLEEGDTVYYDSGRGHGMIAADEGGCEFLAVVFKDRSGGAL